MWRGPMGYIPLESSELVSAGLFDKLCMGRVPGLPDWNQATHQGSSNGGIDRILSFS